MLELQALKDKLGVKVLSGIKQGDFFNHKATDDYLKTRDIKRVFIKDIVQAEVRDGGEGIALYTNSRANHSQVVFKRYGKDVEWYHREDREAHGEVITLIDTRESVMRYMGSSYTAFTDEPIACHGMFYICTDGVTVHCEVTGGDVLLVEAVQVHGEMLDG